MGREQKQKEEEIKEQISRKLLNVKQSILEQRTAIKHKGFIEIGIPKNHEKLFEKEIFCEKKETISIRF